VKVTSVRAARHSVLWHHDEVIHVEVCLNGGMAAFGSGLRPLGASHRKALEVVFRILRQAFEGYAHMRHDRFFDASDNPTATEVQQQICAFVLIRGATV
jgi:hypothetical protein